MRSAGDHPDQNFGSHVIEVMRRELNRFHYRFPEATGSKLNDEVPSTNFWESIPSCDVVTALQKQGTIDAIGRKRGRPVGIPTLSVATELQQHRANSSAAHQFRT